MSGSQVDRLPETPLRIGLLGGSFDPVHSVDQLNAAAAAWAEAFNANAIPHQDTRLRRNGMGEVPVFAVETEGAASLHAALQAGEPKP